VGSVRPFNLPSEIHVKVVRWTPGQLVGARRCSPSIGRRTWARCRWRPSPIAAVVAFARS